MITARDKQIIAALNKFRVMDRDSIAELFFSGLKNPKIAANNVLLRLYRDGNIQRSNHFVPYLYFGPEVEMKKNSAKINHFLAILDVYKEIRALGNMGTFMVEPKYLRKGECAEPDIFTQYRNKSFFIEVQKTIYSEKQMAEKMDRYLDLYNSGIMSTPFPHILIISEQRYPIAVDYPFKVFQADSFTNFINSLKPEPQTIVKKGNGIKRIINE